MTIDFEMRILLVEDSGLTRKMEVKILKEAGFFNILEANDGQEAIQKLQEEGGLHLILSDWNMPKKTGFELLQWVRADEKCKDIPFIMVTAQAEKKQAAQATEAGVSNFITKPFTPPELRNVIEETFGVKKENDTEKAKGPRKTASGKLRLAAAHIQIADHLSLGVLKHFIATGKLNPEHFELETTCMPSWNPVQKALETGGVDAAFILAPIAMDMFSFGVSIKLVLLAHKNGSICIKNKKGGPEKPLKAFYQGKSFYIPHLLSIQHMLSTMFFRELGLKPGVAGKEAVDVLFEVVPPIKMPEFMAKNPGICGYTVAEPLGSKAIAAGTGELTFLSGRIWEYHPCCVVAMRDEVIEAYPEAVQEFVNMLVECGQFIAGNPGDAAQIGVDFLDPAKQLGLTVPVLKKVLQEPAGIKTDDLFPVVEDLDRIQHYMVEEMGIGTIIDLEKFVDTRFAQVACDRTSSVRHSSVMHDMSEVVAEITGEQHVSTREGKGSKPVNKEGKYLIFSLDDQEYGIGILSVKEIIGMIPIRPIPEAPSMLKGVINLRGKVIPVIDLRIKFHMEEMEYNERTCIIVLEMKGKDNAVEIGVVVDEVSEVLNVNGDDIEDTPSFGIDVNTDYILAIAKMGGGVKTLLDVDGLLGKSGNELMEQIA
jgi:chemotaxis signal transduction protein/CheY-like chemotaxis protein